MSGYFIARISVRDPEAYEAYQAKATATTETYGGRYLVRGGADGIAGGKLGGSDGGDRVPRSCRCPGLVQLSGIPSDPSVPPCGFAG